MAKLTAKGRGQIKKKNFASPKGEGPDKEQDQFPIHDEAHAKNALARAAQQLKAGKMTEAEYKKIVKAVCGQFPDMGVCQEQRNKSVNDAVRDRVKK